MERAASKPQVRVDRRANHNVREIAKLRARRAARISAEAAAGRRRMVISAVLALVTGIVAIVAALTPMSLAWTLVSGLALAIELGTSRLAAVRSEKAAQREAKMLAELRGGNQHDRVQGDGDAPADSHAQESQVVAREAIVETRVQVISEGAKTESVEPIEDEANAEEVSTDASASAGDQPIDTTAVDQTDDDAVLSEATASVERRTWSVASVPAPTYAMRGRIAGRMVHPDTDLRGIPKVEARVPARPSEVTLTSGTRSTDQVVASSVVALDLDAVLEARRAL
ncbi:hypothetical protein [Schaalia vaccimaxillae]|uniref:hypothetical protein n=1 Tax=Schaalia vaccimaxillae TaxID=183916 RepID=UPI0004297ED9|nr:hypothetical protein [Schaalia vaccimaxillae]